MIPETETVRELTQWGFEPFLIIILLVGTGLMAVFVIRSFTTVSYNHKEEIKELNAEHRGEVERAHREHREDMRQMADQHSEDQKQCRDQLKMQMTIVSDGLKALVLEVKNINRNNP